MKTKKSEAVNLLVLVPHRDTRLILRKYSETLFKAGFSGAYCFPWVAPLAESKEQRADSNEQGAKSNEGKRGGALDLHGLGKRGREKIVAKEAPSDAADRLWMSESARRGAQETSMRQNKRERFISSSAPGAIPFPAAGDGVQLWGPKLELNFDHRGTQRNDFYSQIVIGTCLLFPGEETSAIPPPPEISFRAAAIAKMSWYPCSPISYNWEIGKLHWLPKNNY